MKNQDWLFATDEYALPGGHVKIGEALEAVYHLDEPMKHFVSRA